MNQGKMQDNLGNVSQKIFWNIDKTSVVWYHILGMSVATNRKSRASAEMELSHLLI